MTLAAKIRARIAAMTPAEKDAAVEHLLAFLAPTDEEIASEVEAMSDEEFDADLRAAGVDPDAWAADMREKMLRWAREARARKAAACTHETTERGKDYPLAHGSHRTEVCPSCGWWRTHGHDAARSHMGSWRPASEYEAATEPVEDES
jgi:acyl-CoA reductase-like NAD-dependent aldehyde dehydrogenase